ncbi:Basic leucine zipper and W2 domain-containing protein 1, partial [Chytridiales sp. JEL 0842]
TCYDDQRLLKMFKAVVAAFYEHDIVSKSAIMYWYDKGAVSQGKSVFQKQMEAFMGWLKTQEEDDDEDEDEEDDE